MGTSFDRLKKDKRFRELPLPFRQNMEEYHKLLLASQLNDRTISDHTHSLLRFFMFLIQMNIKEISFATSDVVSAFLTGIRNELNVFGRKNGSSNLYKYTCSLKRFFADLFDRGVITSNPAAGIKLPKMQKSLPKSILSKEEAMEVLNCPDVKTFQGLKERAILELLYGCGLRNGELRSLKLNDIDLKEGIIIVRQGKGQKDRIVPIGKHSAEWLERYLAVRRAMAPQIHEVFLTFGEQKPMSGTTMFNLFIKLRKKLNMSKPLTPHLLRHSYATHLMENGAALPVISALLGHSCLETTEVYTHVAITELKKTHNQCHPRERIKGGTIDE